MASRIVNLVITLVVMISCDICDVLAVTCRFDVEVSQVMDCDGFRRNMTYDIKFNPDRERERWLYHNCVVGVDQTLPRGLFANPDELGNLRRAQKLHAVPKSRVNIEFPAEDSQPSGVYAIGKVVEGEADLWLPLHARYHRARPGGGMVINYIPRPKLYLRCPDSRLDTCDEPLSPAVTFLCNGSSTEKCSWKEIPFTMKKGKYLQWAIPVGDTHQYYLVATGTALAIIFSSLYLLKMIHDYKRAENKKQYSAAIRKKDTTDKKRTKK